MNRKAPFSVTEAHESPGFLLWQVTMLWQRRIAAVLRPHALTQVQFALLASLLWLSRTESAITQAMLARHAKLDAMMTSQVLRTLEANGLVERDAHPSDTRAKILTLTKKGRVLTWKMVPLVEQADAFFFSAVRSRLAGFNGSLRSLIHQTSIN
jgi:DNA-binding MarR family transcriptional regulator